VTSSVPALIGDLKQYDEQQRRMDEHATAGSDIIDKPTEIKSPVTGSSMQAVQLAATEVCAPARICGATTVSAIKTRSW
jgi:hypothetical protein